MLHLKRSKYSFRLLLDLHESQTENIQSENLIFLSRSAFFLSNFDTRIRRFLWNCCFLTSSKRNLPPFRTLNLPFSLHLLLFSHHNIVFISPLRLNPSLPVHCGNRHLENEIGYINSSTITSAIAFPLYSFSETWLTSNSTITFLTKRNEIHQHMGLALSVES